MKINLTLQGEINDVGRKVTHATASMVALAISQDGAFAQMSFRDQDGEPFTPLVKQQGNVSPIATTIKLNLQEPITRQQVAEAVAKELAAVLSVTCEVAP